MLPKFDRHARHDPKAGTSGGIEASHYDPEARKLTVTFTGQRKYEYSDVSPDKAQIFLNHDSQGTFLHQHIIPRHPAKKV